MNSVIALPIIAASPTTAPAMPAIPDRRALEAYAAWLHMERRLLCLELWPHIAEADRFVWADNAGFNWHFRMGARWDERPQPSSRAAAVLDLAGVDWRQPKEYLGLNHTDNGKRPQQPVRWPHYDGELSVASCNVKMMQLAIDGTDDREKLAPILESRDQSIGVLCTFRAQSHLGLEAKASALEAIGDADDPAFVDLALSLAADILKSRQSTAAPKAEV